MTTPSQEFFILLPPVSIATPKTLVVYHHGMTETGSGVITETIAAKQALFRAIADAGYVVAACNAHLNNWGNSAALADYVELFAYLRVCYNVSKVVFIGQSMGGLSSLLTAAAHSILVAGWAGIYPVCSLSTAYADPSFTASINTAYSISGDYAAKTAGHDPLLLDGSMFTGLRMRFYASASDTSVPAGTHSTPMAALVEDYATENDVVACSGNHGDPSHFQSSDLLSFLGRC